MLCRQCYNKFEAKFHHFYINNIPIIAIYDYDQTLESYIYQFKGCFDIELAPIFLERYKKELHFLFRNFNVVPIPSYYVDDERRGFNHVVEIFKSLELPFTNILVKTESFKQANNKLGDRKKVSNFIKLSSNDFLTDKRILIVDDIYTTGSTLKAAIKLVKSLHPREIRVLVLAKTKFRQITNT